ncbi:MAG: SOS response-associated peptidase [Acidobacteriota bacterium]
MCGRFTTRADPALLASLYAADFQGEGLAPSYNVAPGRKVPVVLVEDGRRVLRAFVWGLVPFWAKDRSIGNRLINARAETLEEKPAFRQAFRKRRCLVLCDGFYEWKAEGSRKVPYHISLPGGEVFAFAGLYERWAPQGEEPLFTCAIVTTAANPSMAAIHGRMPRILAPEEEARWLDPAAGPRELAPLLRPFGGILEARAVSTLVNSPRNDLPDCLLPLQAEEAR